MAGPNESLRAVLAVAPDATLVVDTASRVVFANDLACALFGYTSDEFATMPVEYLIPESMRKDDAYYRTRFLTAPRRTHTGTSTKLRGLHKTGR